MFFSQHIQPSLCIDNWSRERTPDFLKGSLVCEASTRIDPIVTKLPVEHGSWPAEWKEA